MRTVESGGNPGTVTQYTPLIHVTTPAAAAAAAATTTARKLQLDGQDDAEQQHAGRRGTGGQQRATIGESRGVRSRKEATQPSCHRQRVNSFAVVVEAVSALH